MSGFDIKKMKIKENLKPGEQLNPKVENIKVCVLNRSLFPNSERPALLSVLRFLYLLLYQQN